MTPPVTPRNCGQLSASSAPTVNPASRRAASERVARTRVRIVSIDDIRIFILCAGILTGDKSKPEPVLFTQCRIVIVQG